MTETNSCVEKDALIDYLYGEADADAWTRVEAHLRSCVQCDDEVRRLTDVRGTLETWAPPKAELGFRVISDAHPEPAPVSFWGWLRRPPAWGLAAAVLVLAATAAIARPELQIEGGQMVLRVGWRETRADAATRPGVAPAPQSDLAPLRAEPTQEMEALRGTPVAVGSRARDILPVRGGADSSPGPGAGAVADEWLSPVRRLIRESEQRRELALDARVQQFMEIIAGQRQADLSEMQRVFTEFEVTPELTRQQLFEYLRQVAATTGTRDGTNEGPRP